MKNNKYIYLLFIKYMSEKNDDMEIWLILGVKFKKDKLQFFLNLLNFTNDRFYDYDNDVCEEAYKKIEINSENYNHICELLSEGMSPNNLLPQYLVNNITLKSFKNKKGEYDNFSLMFREKLIDYNKEYEENNPFELDSDGCGYEDCNCADSNVKRWLYEKSGENFKFTYHIQFNYS